MSTLFLTSPINNNMFQKTKNNDNYNNQSKDLFFTKRNHKNTKNDSSIKNPNNSLHKKTKNYNKIKELNLFRVKKNNFDKLNKKRNSIYLSRNEEISINPINICLLSDKNTNYCEVKENINIDSRNMIKNENQSFASCSSNETWLTNNCNRRKKSF